MPWDLHEVVVIVLIAQTQEILDNLWTCTSFIVRCHGGTHGLWHTWRPIHAWCTGCTKYASCRRCRRVDAGGVVDADVHTTGTCCTQPQNAAIRAHMRPTFHPFPIQLNFVGREHVGILPFGTLLEHKIDNSGWASSQANSRANSLGGQTQTARKQPSKQPGKQKQLGKQPGKQPGPTQTGRANSRANSRANTNSWANSRANSRANTWLTLSRLLVTFVTPLLT